MATDRTSFSSSLLSAAAADEAQAADDFSSASFLVDLPEEAVREGDAVDDDDSDFVFAVTDSDAFSSASADEIFFEGRILPVYPLFNRDLLPDPSAEEETEAADVAEQIPLRQLLLDDPSPSLPSSSEVPEAAGEFCAWTPNLGKKSASTGTSRRWRLRNLMVGRSQSDGKEKFVFLEAAPPAPPLPAKEKAASTGTSASKAEQGKGTKKAVRVAEMDMATAHRLYYSKGTGSEQAVKGPRRSFVPYRQELYGLFTPINTLQRSRPPF
ncbi:uncharacterized protein LOC141814998 [Curcuma longa]|uniref:uncharacterized protein LOC141814998 n=1 Tax=Curcuma longa TaxID=136217 RepID=UPI003D9F443F